VPEPPPCPVLVVSHLFGLFASELPGHGPVDGPCEQVVDLAASALVTSGASATATITPVIAIANAIFALMVIS
jgi:hypothetical protein